MARADFKSVGGRSASSVGSTPASSAIIRVVLSPIAPGRRRRRGARRGKALRQGAGHAASRTGIRSGAVRRIRRGRGREVPPAAEGGGGDGDRCHRAGKDRSIAGDADQVPACLVVAAPGDNLVIHDLDPSLETAQGFHDCRQALVERCRYARTARPLRPRRNPLHICPDCGGRMLPVGPFPRPPPFPGTDPCTPERSAQSALVGHRSHPTDPQFAALLAPPTAAPDTNAGRPAFAIPRCRTVSATIPITAAGPRGLVN